MLFVNEFICWNERSLFALNDLIEKMRNMLVLSAIRFGRSGIKKERTLKIFVGGKEFWEFDLNLLEYFQLEIFENSSMLFFLLSQKYALFDNNFKNFGFSFGNWIDSMSLNTTQEICNLFEIDLIRKNAYRMKWLWNSSLRPYQRNQHDSRRFFFDLL